MPYRAVEWAMQLKDSAASIGIAKAGSIALSLLVGAWGGGVWFSNQQNNTVSQREQLATLTARTDKMQELIALSNKVTDAAQNRIDALSENGRQTREQLGRIGETLSDMRADVAFLKARVDVKEEAKVGR